MCQATIVESRVASCQSLLEIPEGWSPKERRRRARQGERRREELLRLIASPELCGYEPEIWAVGSLTDEDLQRLAG
jgi:hypothetical protein